MNFIVIGLNYFFMDFPFFFFMDFLMINDDVSSFYQFGFCSIQESRLLFVHIRSSRFTQIWRILKIKVNI